MVFFRRPNFDQIYFFSTWVFFHEHSRFMGQQGKGTGIYLTPLYHFQPVHRHLDNSWAITAESSPLHIASNRTRTGNLGFRAQVQILDTSRLQHMINAKMRVIVLEKKNNLCQLQYILEQKIKCCYAATFLYFSDFLFFLFFHVK